MQPEDERKRIKERELGLEAERIINSPVWQESYEMLARDLNSRMLSSACDDDETLKCKRELRALYDVKKSIETVLTTGQLANRQLEEHENGRREPASPRINR